MDIFPEAQLSKMGKKAMSVLGVKDEEFYEGMGVYFVQLAINIGYAEILKALGRNLRDLLLNLDNLHDYLRTTFPRIKPPSFFIEEESDTRIEKNTLLHIIIKYCCSKCLNANTCYY